MKTISIPAGLAVHARTSATTRHHIFRRAWLWTGFLAFAMIALGPRSAHTAVIEAWVQRHSNVVSNAADKAVKVVRDAAGDIIVTGTTSGSAGGDMVTIKYSGADGSVLWQQRYNDSANAVAVDSSGSVVVTGSGSTVKYGKDGALLWEQRNGGGTSVAVDGSGNVVVTGSSYYTAKYAAADGALLWEQRYNGAANRDDYSHAVAVDGSGNVVVTGSSSTVKYAAADGALLWEQRNGGGASVAVDGSGNVVVTGTSNGDYYTAKYAAASGTLLWERRYNGPENSYDYAKAVAVDGSGNVVVTGASSGDYYTAKYAAADGALLWEQRYNNSAGNADDDANAVAVDGSGNVVVTGSSRNGTNFDYYTAKYAAADGALLWERRYNGPENNSDLARAVTVDGSGNVVVTGVSNAWSSDDVYGGDYYTAKYAATDGALLWEHTYNGSAPTDASARAVAVDGNGNVVVTGYSGSDFNFLGYTNPDYYTAKYAAADGALLWEHRYNGAENDGDHAIAVAVDGSGNVVVTGTSNGDYYTAKYAAVNGALLWEKRYQGPGNSYPNAVAVDGSGNVVVTGRAWSSANDDYYTAKYAAADGALLWARRYNGPANSHDQASAVAVDGRGNVVVTGSSIRAVDSFGNFFFDYYTAKYAAANGALLWEQRYNSAGNGDDYANAVVVDGSGNVVVTGTSNGDYYTTKYAGVNGGLLWEKRYNGPANGYDLATAVAVDGSGNVVVTGGSSGAVDSFGNYIGDYYTAKYAAADGALLWERRYNGPENSYDSAKAVAVDGSGNVVVTGTSNGNYYTAKYAAADGALLWEKRFNGPEYGSSPSLALGPNGMIAVSGSSSGDFATVVYREVPAVSFAAWAACSGLSGTAAAADADPDSDGLPNSVEYIVGGNPTEPGTSGSPTATTSGGNIILTFPRDDESETPDVTLAVEAGHNLLTWRTDFNIGPTTTTSSPGVSITENGTAPDTITVAILQGQATRIFARLKVTIIP